MMKFKDLHPNIRFRVYISFIQRTTQMGVFPFMSIYFASHFGVEAAGVIILCSVIAAFISSLYGGYYSDLLGRKAILLFAEKFRFVTLLIMAVANSAWFNSPEITSFCFLLHTLLVGVSNPASEAMVIDVSTPETRKFVYGINYWATNLAISIGTTAGAFLYEGGFFFLIFFTALASGAIYFIISKFIEETKPKALNGKIEKVSLKDIAISYREVLRDKTFLIFMISSVLLLGIEMQMSHYISVRLAKEFSVQSLLPYDLFNIQVSGINLWGILRMENTLLVVLIAGLVMRITNMLKNDTALVVGITMFTIGYACLAVFNIGWVLLLATFWLTIGELIWVPIQQSLLAKIVPDGKRSQYMAVNAMKTRGGMVLGSLGLTLGAFLPSWAIALIYLVTGAYCIVLYFKLTRPEKKWNSETNLNAPL